MTETKLKDINYKDPHQSIIILIAEDDEEDRMLLQDAMEEGKLANKLFFVEDGEELLDYLQGKDKYQNRDLFPLPGLILLDLNLPKIDGREALKIIKADPILKRIPVIVLTTSKAEEDIVRTYDLGVNSFITKPVSFEGLVDVTQTLSHYWFEIVALPPRK
ncbi:MAG: response regulator [Bacteroidia bacterium]|nr:response regulator [Bacteroidia bacterium]